MNGAPVMLARFDLCRRARRRSCFLSKGAAVAQGIAVAISGSLTPSLVLALLLPGAGVAGPATNGQPVRFAFSRSMFSGLNENDARAAVKAYSEILGAERGIPVDSKPLVFDQVEEIAQAIRDARVDIVSLPSTEFLSLSPELFADRFILSLVNGRVSDDYLLLVRADSPAKEIGDLRGKRLTLLNSPKSYLIPPWIEVLLARQKLGTSARFFGGITPNPKPTRVVLPVFFGQADACVVNREGYSVMCELNPQVEKQLRVLATSPPLLPNITCFRATLAGHTRSNVIAAGVRVSLHPAGKQLMNLFQSDGTVEAGPECLDGARALMTEYRNVMGDAGNGAPNISAVRQDPSEGGKP